MAFGHVASAPTTAASRRRVHTGVNLSGAHRVFLAEDPACVGDGPLVRGPVFPAAIVRGAPPRPARWRRGLLQRGRQYGVLPPGHAGGPGRRALGHGADRLRPERRVAGDEAGRGDRRGTAAPVHGDGALRAWARSRAPRRRVLPRHRLDAAADRARGGRTHRRQAGNGRRSAAAAGGHGAFLIRRTGMPSARYQASGGASGPRSSPPSCPATPMPWWKLSPPPNQPATPTSTSITEDSSRPHGQTAATGSGQRSQALAAATASRVTAEIAWLQAETCRRTTRIISRSTVPTAPATRPISSPATLSTPAICAQNGNPLHRYSRSSGATTDRNAIGNTTSMGCTGCLRIATRLSTVR